jgi:hypothetical protein
MKGMGRLRRGFLPAHMSELPLLPFCAAREDRRIEKKWLIVRQLKTLTCRQLQEPFRGQQQGKT